jgi:hypothetical protein
MALLNEKESRTMLFKVVAVLGNANMPGFASM